MAAIAKPDRRLPTWLGLFQRRRVELSSPYQPSECLERLAKVTTPGDAMSWYHDPRTATRPDPLLRGHVGQSDIWVTRFEPSADGGTVLSGRIGPHIDLEEIRAIYFGLGCLNGLGALAVGVVFAASGHPGALVFAVLSPLPAVRVARSNVAVGRSLEWEIAKLLEEVNAVLDSTATFPGAG
jgi:hypothetical protein